MPGSEYALAASAEEPAILIQLFEMEEGGLEETEYFIGAKASDVMAMPSLESNEGMDKSMNGEMDDDMDDEMDDEEDDDMEDDEEDDEKKEKMDEKYMGFKAVMAAAKKGGARDPAAVAAAIGRKKYGKEKFQAAAAAGKKLGEEVDKIGRAFDKVKPVKAYDKEGKLVGRYRSMDHAKQMKPGHTYKVEEGVVTEAEGTVAVTPKEKALAAHHGDPKKITYGDVIKARLKSAAAKKMGNK